MSLGEACENQLGSVSSPGGWMGMSSQGNKASLSPTVFSSRSQGVSSLGDWVPWGPAVLEPMSSEGHIFQETPESQQEVNVPTGGVIGFFRFTYLFT